jgi:hypothetical protein
VTNYWTRSTQLSATMRTGEPEYRYAKKLFNVEKKIIIMKMARGNKYFQDNYDRKYGIQYMDI